MKQVLSKWLRASADWISSGSKKGGLAKAASKRKIARKAKPTTRSRRSAK